MKNNMSKKKLLVIVLISVAAVLLIAAGIITTVLILSMSKDEPKEEVPEIRYDDPAAEFYGLIETGDDHDYDMLTNEEEKELGTDPYSADTDKDGLGDYYEVSESMTDPLKIDTDGDSLSDYVEIKAGLDPNNVKSDSETSDSKRTFEATYRADDVNVAFAGNANIYSTYCDIFTVTGLEQTPGIMSKIYEIYNKDALQDAVITFEYDEDTVISHGGSIDNLSICQFTADGSFEKVENSKLDTDNQTVSATITQSGKYLLCDLAMAQDEHKTKIMLLIDNSGSMFPKELCEGSDENDVDFKRLDMAKSIIENVDEDVEYGLGKFTGTYTNMSAIGTDKETLLEQIESIRTLEETFDGTYIATSIISSLDNFTSDYGADRKFIIILTDGASTEHSGIFGMLSGNPTEADAVEKCNAKNVSVITIALGNSVDSEYLKTIANGTGGAYIYANNDTALEDVYETIVKRLVYSAEDINGDGNTDSYVVADSGFDIAVNAFNFENFYALVPEGAIKTNGFCYGMAVLAQTFYRDNPIEAGGSFEAKYEKNTFEVSEYDISEVLDSIKNLRDLNGGAIAKWTEIHNVPSADRYEMKDGVLKYKQSLLDKYDDEYLTVKTVNESGIWNNTDYSKHEVLYVDIDKYLKQDTVRDDMEVAKALYWLWATQIEEQDEFSIKSFNLNNSWTSTGNEGDFATVVGKIEEGIPLVVSYQCSAGGHAIDAMRLLRDVNKPTVYYLECYDNNDKEKPYLFKIEQSDMGFWDGTSASNWGKNFCIRPYMNVDGKWKAVSLEFTEIVPN